MPKTFKEEIMDFLDQRGSPTKYVEIFNTPSRVVPRIDSSNHIATKASIDTPFEGQCSSCGTYNVGRNRNSVVYCEKCGCNARLL